MPSSFMMPAGILKGGGGDTLRACFLPSFLPSAAGPLGVIEAIELRRPPAAWTRTGAASKLVAVAGAVGVSLGSEEAGALASERALSGPCGAQGPADASADPPPALSEGVHSFGSGCCCGVVLWLCEWAWSGVIASMAPPVAAAGTAPEPEEGVTAVGDTDRGESEATGPWRARPGDKERSSAMDTWPARRRGGDATPLGGEDVDAEAEAEGGGKGDEEEGEEDDAGGAATDDEVEGAGEWPGSMLE